MPAAHTHPPSVLNGTAVVWVRPGGRVYLPLARAQEVSGRSARISVQAVGGDGFLHALQFQDPLRGGGEGGGDLLIDIVSDQDLPGGRLPLPPGGDGHDVPDD